MGKKTSSKKTFEVLTKLTHDGDKYKRGETVELTDEQAEQLLEASVVKPFQSAPTNTAPVTPPTPPDGDTPPVTPPAGKPEGSDSQ